MLVKNTKLTNRLEEAKKQLRLKGFDTSDNSNLSEILNAIFSGISDNSQEIDKIVEELSFDGRSGKLLDELYNFFGIPRIIKNTKEVSIDMLNNGSNTILINSNTIIMLENDSYRITTEQFIKPKQNKQIYAVPTGTKLFDNYIMIGNIKIQPNNIKIEDIDEKDKELYLNSFLLVSGKVTTLDKESDLEYSARAKGLIQHFSDGNITKIKSYIMGIENVSEVKIYKELNRTRIVIVPDKIQYINQIIEQAQEAVDFFASSMIVFDKPTITQINITGLTAQLSKWFGDSIQQNISNYLTGIREYLNELFKNIYLNDSNIVTSDQIEFTINKYFSDNNILFSLDENKFYINYGIYTDEDYSEPVITKTLERRQSKEFKTDIIIVGDVE